MFSAKNFLFTIFIIVSIIFILGNAQDRTNKAQFVGKYIFVPYTSSISYFKNLAKISKKNEELKKELFHLQIQNRKYNEMILKEKRLSNLNFKSSEEKNKIKIARVIGTSSFLNYENLTINVGKNEGIKVDQPVIGIKGLIGKVVIVHSSYSVVQTFKNRYFRMGALDKRSRIHGIIETDFDGKIYLRKIKVGCDVQIDDEIETSNLSSIFPAGIVLGKVTNIEETSEGLFTQAEIKPFVNLANVEEVAVLVK
ncbi:MAG: rod shape-determining protein MreC [Candidatus Cloacimonetes bacterium]|nr:rod shape-determining protein MreC [Candidatus Cloacimonadota bacterium]